MMEYSLQEKDLTGKGHKELREDYDLMSAIIICPDKKDRENFDGILKLVGTLLDDEVSKEEKYQVLTEEYKIKVTDSIKREVSQMCNLSQGIVEKGIEKGLLKSISSLMKTMNLSPEKAMEALEIPKSSWPQFIELLEKR